LSKCAARKNAVARDKGKGWAKKKDDSSIVHWNQHSTEKRLSERKKKKHAPENTALEESEGTKTGVPLRAGKKKKRSPIQPSNASP